MRKALWGEAAGTFVLVFLGTGAIVLDQQSGGVVTHTGVSMAFGLGVFLMIETFGKISGAHLNPAVTLSFALLQKFSWSRVPLYWLAQLGGALVASMLLHILFPDNLFLGSTQPAGGAATSFFLELLLSLLLMGVILRVSHGSREEGLPAGVIIGGTVFLEAFVAGPVCGASMNPARSIAPALVSGHLQHLWIYMIAPLSGMALSVVLWKRFQTKRPAPHS